jgi:hypothetical protein
MTRLFLSIVCAVAFVMPAAAKDPDQNAYMTRVMKCADKAPAIVEIYLPNRVIYKYPLRSDIPTHDYLLSTLLSMPPTIGWYALDLSSNGKGKSLEPVRVTVSPDKSSIIVNQYTRGSRMNRIPPTTIPIAGGAVKFDRKWATNVTCSELLSPD